jgi:hypothetical protein
VIADPGTGTVLAPVPATPVVVVAGSLPALVVGLAGLISGLIAGLIAGSG